MMLEVGRAVLAHGSESASTFVDVVAIALLTSLLVAQEVGRVLRPSDAFPMLRLVGAPLFLAFVLIVLGRVREG